MRYIIFILLLINLFSCTKHITSTRTIKDSTVVHYRDSVITKSGITTKQSLNIDSLHLAWQNQVLNKGFKGKDYKPTVIVIKDTAGRGEVRNWIDSLGNLQQRFQIYDEKFTVKIKELERTIQDKEISIIEQKKKDWIYQLIIGALLVVIILILIKK